MGVSGESFEKWMSGIKDALEIVLVFCGIGFLLTLIFSSTVQHQIGKGLASLSAVGITSIEVGQLKIELKEQKAATAEARQAAIDIANHPPKLSSSELRQNPQDGAPTPNLAPALQIVTSPGNFWVYLGQFQAGQFLATPNFETANSSIPKAGDRLKALTDTYERDAVPKLEGSKWKLGNIIGVVREGQYVFVRETVSVEGGNIWLHADTER